MPSVRELLLTCTHSLKGAIFALADVDDLLDLPVLDCFGDGDKVVVRVLVLDVHQHAQQLATVQSHEKDEEERAEEHVRLCEEKLRMLRGLNNTLALYEYRERRLRIDIM